MLAMTTRRKRMTIRRRRKGRRKVSLRMPGKSSCGTEERAVQPCQQPHYAGDSKKTVPAAS